jgi:hypothetical protein
LEKSNSDLKIIKYPCLIQSPNLLNFKNVKTL